MSDFPESRHPPATIYPSSIEACQGMSVTVTASVAWAANRGVWVPFGIDYIFPMTKFFWCNGTVVAGNVDVGIYSFDATPTKLFSTGATAQATASVVQSVANTSVLSPGQYYMAFMSTSSTATFSRYSPGIPQGAALGLAEQLALSLNLPTTATLVRVATSSIPVFGISSV